MRAFAILGAACLMTSACAPVTACDTTSPLIGTWRYSSTREAPHSGTASGTLTVSAVSCGTLAGQMDITESDNFGVPRRLAGPVTGSVTSAGTVRFDATFGDDVRQHLATLTSDTLDGSWVSVESEGTATGAFGGKRQ